MFIFGNVSYNSHWGKRLILFLFLVHRLIKTQNKTEKGEKRGGEHRGWIFPEICLNLTDLLT